MIVYILWIICMGIEIGLGRACLKKKSHLLKEKVYVRLIVLFMWLLLVMTPIIRFSFRWYSVSIVIASLELFSVVSYFSNKKQKPIKKVGTVVKMVLMCLVIVVAFVPPVLLPQSYEPIIEGPYGVKSACYT